MCGKWEAGSGHDTAGITRPSAHSPTPVVSSLNIFAESFSIFFSFVEFSLFEGKSVRVKDIWTPIQLRAKSSQSDLMSCRALHPFYILHTSFYIAHFTLWILHTAQQLFQMENVEFDNVWLT